MKHIAKYIAAAACAALLAACHGGNEWTVSGKIEGAGEQVMVLEASSNGRWYALDSVKLPASGSFSISHEAMGYPDIYRLRLADKSLYFPIDSIESVNVVAKADAFDRDYTLSGSPSAERMMNVDRKVMEAASALGVTKLQADTSLKRELGRMVLGDPAGIVSYYILNKKVGGVPLYDPTDNFDIRIIGAVANAYSQLRPGDPRTEWLKTLFLSNRPITSASTDTITANEVNLIDITLYDNAGTEHTLSKVAAANRVVLLNFTVYGAQESPAYNAELKRIYDRYHPQGLEIYQVGVDDNEYQWRRAARNLPWITVYNSPSLLDNLLRYNVNVLPATFIIVDGEIAERVEQPSATAAAVAKRF